LKYYVTTSKENINHLSNRKINNVSVQGNNLSFETNEQSLTKLLEDLNNISYFNKRKSKIIIFLKKYFISILSILIFFVFIINEQFVIKKIEFINENTYNQEVVDYLYQNSLDKRLIYYYLNSSITSINTNLKQEFYYYEWINVNKKGNILQVFIDKQDEKSYLDSTSNLKGDLIASRDGIIRYYFIKKGVNLIKDNQSVKAGDVLVSGNLLINNEQVKYIHPLGVVLAEVADYEKIRVKKVNYEYLRTGKIEVQDKIIFFNLSTKNKITFEMYEEEQKTIFNYKIIKRIKNIYYEVKEIINTYNDEQAEQYAQSIIEKEFNNNKINDKESILEIHLIKSSEDEEYYYYDFLVKKIINIAFFKAVNLEEKK